MIQSSMASSAGHIYNALKLAANAPTPNAPTNGLDDSKSAKSSMMLVALNDLTGETKSKKAFEIDGNQLSAAQKEAKNKARIEAKKQHKAKLKSLKEQFEIMKRVLANDPIKLAKYLKNITVEMRKILKEFAALNKEDKKGADEAALSGAVGVPQMSLLLKVQENGPTDAALTSSDLPDDDEKIETASDIEAEAPDPTPEDEIEPKVTIDTDDAATQATKDTTSSESAPKLTIEAIGIVTTYPAVPEAKSAIPTPEQVAEAKSDMGLVGDMRAFIKKMKEVFEEAKIKGTFNAQDPKEKAKAYEELGKGFKELETDIDDFAKGLQKVIDMGGAAQEAA